MRRNKTKLLLAILVHRLLRLLTWIFPGQSNNFGFAIIKPRIPDDLHRWITSDGKEMIANRAWLENRYGALRKPPIT
jgi:hypothetical protein